MEFSHLPEGPLAIVSQVSGLPWKIVLPSICAQLTCSSFKSNPLPTVVWYLTATFTTALSILAIVSHRTCMSAFQAEESQRLPPALVRLSLRSLLLRSSFAPRHSLEIRMRGHTGSQTQSLPAWEHGPRAPGKDLGQLSGLLYRQWSPNHFPFCL